MTPREARAPRRLLREPHPGPGLLLPDGRRPELLLVARKTEHAAVLGSALFEAGFDVYRASDPEVARGLVAGRDSILMALVAMGASWPGLPALVANLARLRPGLWIGMLGSDAPEGRRAASEGYRAGADDLFPMGQALAETARRVRISLPRALSKRRLASRRRRRKGWASRTLELSGTALAGLGLGVALALLVRILPGLLPPDPAPWERWEAWLAASVAGRERGPSELERWDRTQRLELDRHRLQEEILFRRSEAEETRLDHLFRAKSPQYPRP